MNDEVNDTAQVIGWTVFSVALVAGAVVLAYYVTPWALLMLFFVPSYRLRDSVTVERGDTTVTVKKKELDEIDVERAVEEAQGSVAEAPSPQGVERLK